MIPNKAKGALKFHQGALCGTLQATKLILKDLSNILTT